jgi:hypothetical protein
MGNQGLKKIGKGFYRGAGGELYLHMPEFLTSHNLPDREGVREQVWTEVRRQFGEGGVMEFDDDEDFS